MTDAKRSSKINPLDNSQISDYVQQYASRRPLQEQFTGKFVTLLKALIQVKDIEVHLIESRTKDIVSFQEKRENL
jgi:GTP cyclohydrolase I